MAKAKFEYDSYKLCPKLTPRNTCFVLELYVAGEFEERFHTHVPNYRLPQDTRSDVLRALVMRFHGGDGMSAEDIVRAHLNERGKTPSKDTRLRIVSSFPEPGVLRFYCGTNTRAWCDHVFRPEEFRQARER